MNIHFEVLRADSVCLQIQKSDGKSIELLFDRPANVLYWQHYAGMPPTASCELEEMDNLLIDQGQIYVGCHFEVIRAIAVFKCFDDRSLFMTSLWLNKIGVE
jgi:hypothetical protein